MAERDDHDLKSFADEHGLTGEAWEVLQQLVAAALRPEAPTGVTASPPDDGPGRRR